MTEVLFEEEVGLIPGSVCLLGQTRHSGLGRICIIMGSASEVFVVARTV